MKGRRLPDTPQRNLAADYDDLRPGDYWKVLDDNGAPLRADFESNLTGTCWVVIAPTEDEHGWMLGDLRRHTVREEEDGTISVRPNDGSSNSILITGSYGRQYHGFIEHGEWTDNDA